MHGLIFGFACNKGPLTSAKPTDDTVVPLFPAACFKDQAMHPEPSIFGPKPGRRMRVGVWPVIANSKKIFASLIINSGTQNLTQNSLERRCCIENQNSAMAVRSYDDNDII